MLKEGGTTDEERVKWAYREVIGRPANPKEVPVLLELYKGQRDSFTADPAGAAKLLSIGQIKPDPALQPIEAAAAATVASALFNLDASITLR